MQPLFGAMFPWTMIGAFFSMDSMIQAPYSNDLLRSSSFSPEIILSRFSSAFFLQFGQLLA